ncbi:helix-turn-helix transcriptional regulator [Cryobacterium arcticum]|uniref:DNA-binding protein n=1 Tax=Cryobacterium arcticum TaxID=670052 RepID=A0A1B1BPP3_9MICO|nr:hypothetical protein [Cryobacterium arcticum]ANP74495.1 hypothetical protein PA27867_3573 [Cryobacterium arcticum]
MSASRIILGPEQVREKTGHAVQTLYHWRTLSKQQGKLVGPRSFKLGRLVRYYEDDVDAWIAEQAKASA